jgi:hypothetical protein
MLARLRRLMWKRRVDGAHQAPDVQRAEYTAAITRILDDARTLPDPAGQRTRRSA